MSNFSDDYCTRPIENFNPEFRESIERAYVADPKKTRAELIYRGLWYVATQLNIDYAAGRLS